MHLSPLCRAFAAQALLLGPVFSFGNGSTGYRSTAAERIKHMAELLMHFELAAGQEASATAQTLQKKLGELPGVSEAEALPDKTRLTGVEVIAAISAAVVVLHHGRDLVAELNKLLPELKKLVRNMKGLKKAYLEVGTKRVALDEVTPDHVNELAKS